MSAHHESVPVFKKNAGIAALLLLAQIIVSCGAAPVLTGDMSVGVKLAICTGIAVLWTIFCLYAGKAFEAGYLASMELTAHPPVPAADTKLAKAA